LPVVQAFEPGHPTDTANLYYLRVATNHYSAGLRVSDIDNAGTWITQGDWAEHDVLPRRIDDTEGKALVEAFCSSA
jgi:hypothetical protein